jgi:hypothetical protein
VSTLGIVLLAIGALIVVLVAGGWVAATRRTRSREEALCRELERAQRALSQAQALDRGWDRTVMDAAARRAAAQRLGDGAFSELQLVQVIDKPGKDNDQAVYRVETADGDEHRITLGRTDDVWHPA